MAWRPIAIAFVLACSANTQPTGTDGPPPGDGSTIDALTSEQACAELATDRCMMLQMCSPSSLERRYSDLGTCETREALACTQAQDAADTALTPAQALACGTAIAASTCDAFLNHPEPAACLASPGPGTGGCSFSAQCTTTFCALGAFALCGQCRDIPQPGTSCATSGCGPTLVCSATQVCAAPGALNAPCDLALPCASGLTCVGATSTAKGTCQTEIATLGAACDSTHKVRAGCAVDLGLACNVATNKCVSLPLAAAGQPCGVINNVATLCTAGASCKIPANQQSGTCLAPAADGGACDTMAGPVCLFPARCIPNGSGTSGTCQFLGSMACF